MSCRSGGRRCTSGLLMLLVLALVLGLVPRRAAAQPIDRGVVTHVSDGDTLWLRADGPRRKPVKLRLLGLDAPESCQAGGAAATAALSARLLHQRVEVQGRVADRYGRRLVRLRLERGGDDIGAWLVRGGHAWSDSYHGRAGPYAAEEAAARSARRGLFAHADALPPAEFRRRHGPCDGAAPQPGSRASSWLYRAPAWRRRSARLSCRSRPTFHDPVPCAPCVPIAPPAWSTAPISAAPARPAGARCLPAPAGRRQRLQRPQRRATASCGSDAKPRGAAARR